MEGRVRHRRTKGTVTDGPLLYITAPTLDPTSAHVTVVIGKGDGWSLSLWGKTDGFVREIVIDENGLTYVVQERRSGPNMIVSVPEKRIKPA